MDNYAVSYYVPQLPQQSFKVIEYTSQQKEWQAYLKALTTEKEYEVLNCLATHESRWQQKWNYMYVVNPQKYTAYGIFQILESTARGVDPTLDRKDPHQNIELAVKLYRSSGKSPWLVAPLCP